MGSPLSTKTQHGGSEQDRAYVENIHLLCFRLQLIWIIFAITCRYAILIHRRGRAANAFFCNKASIPWTALNPEALWRSHLVGLTDWHFEDRHVLFKTP